eukprot:TRINITY_DN5071_c0_g1_i1.p1 TRINITY_DN5071_c0_g1~~TRINITY_DN5071_c0_g1_i1.p1  ORF type:complete len:554 (-),score=174.69 TRINITY_DN5071_c0_g1_i1:1003-2664(-)
MRANVHSFLFHFILFCSISPSLCGFWSSLKESINIPEAFRPSNSRFDEGISTLSLCFSENNPHENYYVVVPPHLRFKKERLDIPIDSEMKEEDALKEFFSFHQKYVWERHGSNLIPGQRIHLPQFQKGRLFMIGSPTNSKHLHHESSSLHLKLRNMNQILLRSIPFSKEISNFDRIECTSSYDSSLDTLLSELSEDESKHIYESSSITVLSMPQPGSGYHFYNEIDIKSSATNNIISNAMYSTFLASFSQHTGPSLSLSDILMKKLGLEEWRSQQKVILSSSFIIYWNRFSIQLEIEEIEEENSQEKKNQSQLFSGFRSSLFGVIDNVVYGTYFHLDVSIEALLYEQSEAYESLKNLQEILQDPNPKFEENSISLLNATLWTPYNIPITLNNTNIEGLLGAIQEAQKRMLKYEMSEEPLSSLKHILPIGLTAKKVLSSKEKVAFFFTQCVGSQSYPLGVLVMISNILLGGTLLALFVAIALLSTATYVIASNICYILFQRGVHPSPDYITFVPIQFHLLTLRWRRNRGTTEVIAAEPENSEEEAIGEGLEWED